jgi:hypothetical protein
MKKNSKLRLTLSRETLRALDAEEMTKAPGGVVSMPFCLITQPCVSQTCPTRCGQTYCFYV